MYPKVPFHPTPLWEVWVPDSRSTTSRAQHLPASCFKLGFRPNRAAIKLQRQEGVLLMMRRPRRSIRCFTLTVWTLQTALTAEAPLRQHQAMMKSLCDKIRILFPAKEGWRGNLEPTPTLDGDGRGRARHRGYHGRLDCPVVRQLGEAGLFLHGRFGCSQETSRHLVWGWGHFCGGNPRLRCRTCRSDEMDAISSLAEMQVIQCSLAE